MQKIVKLGFRYLNNNGHWNKLQLVLAIMFYLTDSLVTSWKLD